MTVKNRIKTFCKEEGIPVSAFEESIGVSNGYVNAISKSIGLDKINSIVETYSNLNIEWLLTGRGDMLKTKRTTGNTFLPRNEFDECKSTNLSTEKQTNAPQNDNVIIPQLISTIQDQAEEIGRLKARVEQLERELEDANTPPDAAEALQTVPPKVLKGA